MNQEIDILSKYNQILRLLENKISEKISDGLKWLREGSDMGFEMIERQSEVDV